MFKNEWIFSLLSEGRSKYINVSVILAGSKELLLTQDKIPVFLNAELLFLKTYSCYGSLACMCCAWGQVSKRCRVFVHKWMDRFLCVTFLFCASSQASTGCSMPVSNLIVQKRTNEKWGGLLQARRRLDAVCLYRI